MVKPGCASDYIYFMRGNRLRFNAPQDKRCGQDDSTPNGRAGHAARRAPNARPGLGEVYSTERCTPSLRPVINNGTEFLEASRLEWLGPGDGDCGLLEEESGTRECGEARKMEMFLKMKISSWLDSCTE